MAKKIVPCTTRTKEQLEKAKERNEELEARIKAKKKENEEYYKRLLERDPNTLPFLLYHGTDAKMIGLSKEDRSSLFRIFCDVIDTVWPSFEPIIYQLIENGLPRPGGNELTESEEERYRRIMSDLTIINMYKNDNQMYAYGDFYLDVNLNQAIGYANLASHGGELGRLAHSILEGAKILGFDMMSFGGEEFYRNAGTVLQIAGMPAKPVVFAFEHLELEKLRNMQGGHVDWVGMGGNQPTQHFRYLGEVKLDKGHATYVLDFEKMSDLRKALRPY